VHAHEVPVHEMHTREIYAHRSMTFLEVWRWLISHFGAKWQLGTLCPYCPR
jgi:hypothetical protein